MARTGARPTSDNGACPPAHEAALVAACEAMGTGGDPGTFERSVRELMQQMSVDEGAGPHLGDDRDQEDAWDSDDDDDDQDEDTELTTVAPSVELTTLSLRVPVPYPRIKKTPWRLAKPGGPPVRPFGAAAGHDEAIRDLAEALAPRLIGVAGGREQLEKEPLLAPLCAVVATVWAVMQSPKARTRERRPRPRADVLRAAVAALDLGSHEPTLERVLVRNHEDHIPVRADVPSPWTLSEWEGWLGLFEADDKGLVTVVKGHGQRRPRVLRSLLSREPL